MTYLRTANGGRLWNQRKFEDEYVWENRAVTGQPTNVKIEHSFCRLFQLRMNSLNAVISLQPGAGNHGIDRLVLVCAHMRAHTHVGVHWELARRSRIYRHIYAHSPNTEDAEAGRSLAFEASQATVTACLEQTHTTKAQEIFLVHLHSWVLGRVLHNFHGKSWGRNPHHCLKSEEIQAQGVKHVFEFESYHPPLPGITLSYTEVHAWWVSTVLLCQIPVSLTCSECSWATL